MKEGFVIKVRSQVERDVKANGLMVVEHVVSVIWRPLSMSIERRGQDSSTGRVSRGRRDR